MKYKSIYFTLLSLFLKRLMIQKFGHIKTKKSLKKAKQLYKNMLEKTENIGAGNPMAGNIYLGYVFMSICRAGNFSVEDFTEITTAFMRSKFIHKILGTLDLNKTGDVRKLSAKMHKIAAWADEHPQYKDKTWDFNFNDELHRDGFYYHFTRCPMEKFARENGYLDLLPLCCNIDYLTFEAKKSVLHRNQTLGSGGDICDYWIVGDKLQDPE